MTSDEELGEWLRKEDEVSRSFRVERLRWLIHRFGEPKDFFLPGGLISFPAFEEARLCYLNGQYIGCVILSQVIVEHILGGMFAMAGRDDLQRAPFHSLLCEALSVGIITADEYEDFDALRTIRNPYSHPRSPSDDHAIGRRMLEENVHVYDLFKEDARTALATVFGLLGRYPFSFQPSVE